MLAAMALCMAAQANLKEETRIAKISYGPESRQWLDIYPAKSKSPTPVYIWAHANGSTAENIQDVILEEMHAIGVSVVSWESIAKLKSVSDLKTGWADAERMVAWVKANAEKYNLDPEKIIIGGRSRGSGISWKIAHSADPSVIGIYMYNALPKGFWGFPSEFDPVADVNADSPPLFLTYGPTPGDGNGHHPGYGMKIEDRYRELGIGKSVTIVHSLSGSDNDDPWQYLREFILSIIE